MVADPEPYTHYRATDSAPVETGVYRVVGTDADSVVVLRVADGDGRRVATGEISSVPRERLDAAFTDAEDPDAGFRVGQAIEGVTESVRMVAGWIGRLVGAGRG